MDAAIDSTISTRKGLFSPKKIMMKQMTFTSFFDS
jgi:hypothetical protein